MGGANDLHKSIRQSTREYTRQSESSTAVVIHGAVAHGNVFQDVVTGPDSHQVIVSTRGKHISAENVTAANGATQWLGQMSDTTLQQMVSCYKDGTLKSNPNEAQVLKAKKNIISDRDQKSALSQTRPSDESVDSVK